jgi:ubiquinone/menaquinone biosynthesis C-methylase UbiE
MPANLLKPTVGFEPTTPALRECVGTAGRIVGIDLSPDMLEIAAQRMRSHGWENVTLIEASVDEAEIPATADAALFSFTHDVLQSPRAAASERSVSR